MSLRTEQENEQKSIRDRAAYIINVGDEKWEIQRPYMRGVPYVVEPRGNSRYSALEVKGAKDKIDMGDRRTVPVEWMADEIARDLIREQNLGEYGLFVSLTQKPDEKALLAAEQQRDATYVRIVQEADTEWSRHHNIALIADVAKRCCQRLGLKRDWLYEVPLQKDCPACGEKIRPGVAICKRCKAIVDPKKYAEMKFAGAA